MYSLCFSVYLAYYFQIKSDRSFMLNYKKKKETKNSSLLRQETIPTPLQIIWVLFRKYVEISLVRFIYLVFKYIWHYDVDTAEPAAAAFTCSTGAGSSIMLFATPNIFYSNKGFFMGEILSFKPSVARVLKMLQKLYFLYLYKWSFQLPICLLVCLFIYLV